MCGELGDDGVGVLVAEGCGDGAARLDVEVEFGALADDLAEVLALQCSCGCVMEKHGGDGRLISVQKYVPERAMGLEVVGCADLPAGGALGLELGVGLGGLRADLAGAVELVHGGGAEGAEDGGWMVAAEAIWRTMPRRGAGDELAAVGGEGGGSGLGWVMAWVSRLAAESRRRESAAEVLRRRPVGRWRGLRRSRR